MKFASERKERIKARLGNDDESHLLDAVHRLSNSAPLGRGWVNYARSTSETISRAGWRERLTAPKNCVRSQARALSDLCSPHGIVITDETHAHAVDIVVEAKKPIADDLWNEVIGWISAELSISTVATHGVQTAVGLRRDASSVRLRAVPPPRPPFWLALLGKSGDAISSEFLRHHQLLLSTHEQIETVGALADEAERHLTDVLDTLDAGFMHIEAERGALMMSERLIQLVGFEATDLQTFSSRWLQRTPVEHHEATEIGLDALETAEAGVYSLAILDDGASRVFELAVYASESGVSATFSENTEAYLADRRAAKRRMTLDSLLEAAPFAIAVHRDDELLFANQQYHEELADHLQSPTERTIRVSQRGTSILPIPSLEIVEESGVCRAFEQNTSLIDWDGDGYGAFLTVFRETTQEREFLARSFELDRVVALGTLADGVAHEINNPLAYVQSNIEFARNALERRASDVDPSLVEALADAHDGTRRVSKLVSEFRHVAPGGHGDDTKGESVDLIEVLEAARNIANATVRERATVSMSLDIPGPVHAQSSRLVQVFINLLVNAAQSIPDGRRGQIRVVAVNPAPDVVRVEVRDNGQGIPPDLLQSVFKPFFTTKPAGEGTGLGLSICRNIVEQFGGTLDLESTLGVGTTAAVELPLALAEAKQDLSLASFVSDAFDDGIRLLVIDDDPQILRMIERVLRRTCRVTTTRSPKEALALLRNGDFDAVLSDVYMPEMTGPELFDRIVKYRPEYENRVWMMTGGRKRASEDLNALTVEKPFGIDALKKIVRQAQALREVA